MSAWRGFDEPLAGYVNLFNHAIRSAAGLTPDLFLAVNEGHQIIASDYSGQHRGATHEVYSFLITTRDCLRSWLPARDAFRSQYLPDGRRLSFKQLRESMRRRAYPHFLDLCSTLPSNLITIMIDSRIETFIDGGPNALAEALPDCFAADASPRGIEKVYRLAIFVATIQAWLRREDQPSFWISDHDETLDTFDKRERIARLASYLTFGLTRWQNAADLLFMTTGMPGLPEWAEDLAAIPDIAAGACAALSDKLPLFLDRPRWVVALGSEGQIDWRAQIFGDWLSEPHGRLHHVLLRLAPDTSGQLRASAQRFERRSFKR